MKNKALLIGFFNPLTEVANTGSPAGAKVQLQILRSLGETYEDPKAFVLREKRSWPYSKLVEKKVQIDNVIYPLLFNFKLLKFLIFSVSLFLYAIKNNCRDIYQYNSYFFVNIVCLILRLLGRNSTLILQDVHCKPRFLDSLKQGRVVEWLSLQIAKLAYTQIVPISETIVEDFKIKRKKCFVWPGGIVGKVESDDEDTQLSKYAVLAGTLNPYNGALELCRAWLEQEIDIPLHIFGKGPDKSQIIELTKLSSLIIYHGKVPPQVVEKFTKNATFNFCLRYDENIDQRYFFPSKFFDVYVCKGNAIVNDFYGLSNKMKLNVFIVKDDLNNLSTLMNSIGFNYSKESYFSRVEYAKENFSWDRCIKILHQKLHCKD